MNFVEERLGVKAPRLRDPACAGDFEFRIGEGLLTQRPLRALPEFEGGLPYYVPHARDFEGSKLAQRG